MTRSLVTLSFLATAVLTASTRPQRGQISLRIQSLGCTLRRQAHGIIWRGESAAERAATQCNHKLLVTSLEAKLPPDVPSVELDCRTRDTEYIGNLVSGLSEFHEGRYL